MTVNRAAGVTPATFRNGAPEALAAVCIARGAAVLAYCQQEVGPDDAVEVAAAAFAELRRAILAPGSLTSRNQAEALLRSVTRHAAMAHAVNAADGGVQRPVSAGCDRRGSELLGYVANTLTKPDREALEAHVRECRSCAAALRRLQSAEDAFKLRPGTPLPDPAAREILTALAHAAPVSGHDGDAIAVRNEALRLFTGNARVAVEPAPEHTEPIDEPEHTEPPPEHAEPPPEHAEPPPEHAEPPPEHAEPPPERTEPIDDPAPEPQPRVHEPPQQPAPAPPTPVAPAPAPPSRPRRARPEAPSAPPEHGRIDRLRGRLPWSGRQRFGPSRSAMLLRGLARLAAVVALAATTGLLIGVGMAALTGADDAAPPTPDAPTSSTPSVTTSSAPTVAAEKVRVETLSAIARPPANGTAEGARVNVRVRVENASGRVVRPEPPELLVGDLRLAPASTAVARELLAASLAAGAAAEGTLRFDVQSTTPSELKTARVRLRIAGKTVVLEPELASAAAG